MSIETNKSLILSELRTFPSTDGKSVGFLFKFDDNQEVTIEISRLDLPQLLSVVRSQIAPTDGLPIDLMTLQPGTTYVMRSHQIVEKKGQKYLNLHLDIPTQNRTVTLDLPLSKEDIKTLIQMLTKAL